jgi:RNA polymerase sigma-70 factor (ECF subfamily)
LESGVIVREEARIVRDLVASLPEKLRIPIILYYTMELSVSDIASTMQLP